MTIELESVLKEDLLAYAAGQVRNREAFLLNFPDDFRAFDFLIGGLRQVWARIGAERDTKGKSHAGLLPLVNLLVRHAIFGFQHMSYYQSFLGWLTFRPGLEALLILGKWVDDPANAKIWRNRQSDTRTYQKTFSGRGLISKRLPRSEDYRTILGTLNDEFMHPNPKFTYRDHSVRDEGATALVEVQYFDTRPELHEAHLVAYLNLLDNVLWSSNSLVIELCGPSPWGTATRPPFAEIESSRAEGLAKRDPLCRKIMEDLGLWVF